MKRLALVLFFVCSTATIPAFAETEAFGLGVLLGEPTGISAKARLGPTSAIDAAAAWSFRGEGSFYFHADYLVHFTDIFHVDPGEMPLYLGVGGKIALRDDPQLGVRIPVGIAYEFESVPLDVFFEVAPGVGLFPETDIDFGGGLGIRYYFAGGSSGS